jgi:NAD(P)-dependent dehydrogenase (short-subunit alcohol dehydrogenase family)
MISRDIAAGGAKAVAVHYNSDSSRAAADETVAAVKAFGAEAVAIQGDLSVPANVDRLFDQTKELFGKVNIAINTTGMVIRKPIVDISEADYDKIFDVNAKASFFFIQKAGKTLEDRGNILTIVSSLLAAYIDLYSIYPGSKSPVEHYTRAASKEFGGRGISVNALGPGPMETPFFYGQEDEASVNLAKSGVTLGAFSRSGLTDPEDIVPTVRFLVTEGWWITGQTIFSNGGFTTR